MLFRKSEPKELENILEIVVETQKYFKENGIDQWQNGYPNRETILDDMNKDQSYVLLDDNDEICGICTISFIEEESYKKIVDGEWKSDIETVPYGVIHRIAIKGNLKKKGVGSFIFREVEKIVRAKNINSIKVDTHEDNKPMQESMKRNGYEYCGVVYIQGGAKRVAFEKLLSE